MVLAQSCVSPSIEQRPVSTSPNVLIQIDWLRNVNYPSLAATATEVMSSNTNVHR